MERVLYFLSTGIWKIKAEQLKPMKRFWVRFLRICLLTKKAFDTNQLQQGACTLTYYTVLGLVPMIILLLGIARGFSQENFVINSLFARFSGQKEVLVHLIDFAKNALSQLGSGMIAFIGILILLWSAVKVLSYLEVALNAIGDVRKKRTLVKQFSDYLAMLLFSPILFFISNGFTLYLSAKVSSIKSENPFFQEIHPLLFIFYNLLSFFLTSFLFTFIYMFMPNTKVQFKAAVYAGLIASFFYQVVQFLYLSFQFGVAKHNAIYGTFAAIPLFLIWVHLSWLILLLGAKIAFSFQNLAAYEFITNDFQLNQRDEKLLILRIAHFCVSCFCKEVHAAPSAVQISHALSIPLFLTHSLLQTLIEAKVLIEVKREDEEVGYVPIHDPETLTIKSVIDKIETKGERFPSSKAYEYKELLKRVEVFYSLMEKSNANIPLKDL